MDSLNFGFTCDMCGYHVRSANCEIVKNHISNHKLDVQFATHCHIPNCSYVCYKYTTFLRHWYSCQEKFKSKQQNFVLQDVNFELSALLIATDRDLQAGNVTVP